MRTFATLFSSLLIIFTIVTSQQWSLSSAQSAPVLDTDGDPVRAGVDYYAVPPAGNSTGGGGLGLQGGAANLGCPLDVVQELDQTSNGLPLFFLPVNPSDEVVNSGVDQNVLFNASSICVMTTLWTLHSDDEIPAWHVSTGGQVGNPGRETLSNWFSVETFEEAYMFVYCPTVCETCRPRCGSIGVINVEDGRRVLGLSDQPLKVTFKKV